MQTPLKHPRAAKPATLMTAARTATEPHLQPATPALARALRSRSPAAEESAGTGGTARVPIITPATVRLARHICAAEDGKPWSWRSGQPLCPGAALVIAWLAVTVVISVTAAIGYATVAGHGTGNLTEDSATGAGKEDAL
jgi:hypothetical protein